jgi:hypothetical protein
MCFFEIRRAFQVYQFFKCNFLRQPVKQNLPNEVRSFQFASGKFFPILCIQNFC